MISMKLCLLLVVVITVCESKTLWHQLDGYSFENWMVEFGKNYSSVEERVYRQSIWSQNLAKIKAHNADTTKPWKEGVNHMTDWTKDEFKSLLGYRRDMGYSMVKPTLNYKYLGSKAWPPAVDWRNSSCVTAVKDQGQCGSCWSFGSAETLESTVCLKTGILYTLSEQNILDCTPNPDHCGGTGGCGGGTAELAYAAMVKNGGLESEWTYPYQSYQGSDFSCRMNAGRAVVRVTGYTQIPSNQYEPLMDALTQGTVSITVEAESWMAYESGVFNGCSWILDHNVQLVGYGNENGKDYYLVRNSWGPAWGEKGYIRIMRTANESSHCGTDTDPSQGSGCSGGPPTVTVCGTCGILYDNVVPTI